MVGKINHVVIFAGSRMLVDHRGVKCDKNIRDICLFSTYFHVICGLPQLGIYLFNLNTQIFQDLQKHTRQVVAEVNHHPLSYMIGSQVHSTK